MGIRDLNQGTIALDSQIPFGDSPNGCDRRTSVAEMLALATAATSGGFITQYAAPALTGFIVTVSPPQAGTDVWLQLRPTADFAGGNITLPAQANCVDQQEVLVSCNHAVTALTVNGNGATVNGAPTTLAANGHFRLKFDGVFKDWTIV